MKNNSIRNIITFYTIFFVILVALVPLKSHGGDMSFWNGWANNIFQFGLGNIYNTDANYHPIFLFVLWFYGLFQNSITEIESNIYLIKIFPLIFDFVILIPIYFLCRKFNINFSLTLLLILNIAYLYNSYLWGQVDSVPTNLVISSIILILLEKPYWAAVCFILALNTKMQAIFFLPILGLLYLIKPNYKKIVFSLLLIILIQVIILTPFLVSDTIDKLWNVITGSVDFYPFISMNAHNIWYWLFPNHSDLMAINDFNKYGVLTYKTIGTILFLFFSVIVLLPLLWKIFKQNFKLHDKMDWAMVFLISTLIPLIFFYFNTQMHERYSHPIIITSFIYGLLSKKYDLYILASIGYFMNLEKVLKYFSLEYQTLIFEPRFISLFFLAILLIGLIRLYRDYLIPELKNKKTN